MGAGRGGASRLGDGDEGLASKGLAMVGDEVGVRFCC